MIAGLILARGGSVGIPRKNVKLLAGVPLINYTIRAALDSNLDAVYLTTEDDEIARIAWDCANEWNETRQQGVRGKEFGVFTRPSCLASSSVQSDETLLFLYRQLQQAGIDPDTLVMLQPTSPFRTARHINEAIDLFNKGCENGLHTVVSCHVADGFYWKIDEWGEDYITPVHHDPTKRQGRQWIPKSDKMYRENGSLYCVDATRFGIERSYRLAPFTLYEMDERDSIDLDTMDDWLKAEQEIERRKSL